MCDFFLLTISFRYGFTLGSLFAGLAGLHCIAIFKNIFYNCPSFNQFWPASSKKIKRHIQSFYNIILEPKELALPVGLGTKWGGGSFSMQLKNFGGYFPFQMEKVLLIW